MEEPKLFPDRPQADDHVKKESSQQEAYTQISKSVTALGSRLRVLEEQYTILRNKSQLADSNLIEFEKDLREDLRTLSEEVLELKRTMKSVLEKLDVISEEMNNSVKEHEFKVLEKYVDLWNPGNFVTKAKLKELLQNK